MTVRDIFSNTMEAQEHCGFLRSRFVRPPIVLKDTSCSVALSPVTGATRRRLSNSSTLLLQDGFDLIDEGRGWRKKS